MSVNTDLKKMFRRSFFGGFKKKDVQEYIHTLEEKLEQKNGETVSGLTEEDKSIIDESIKEINRLKTERSLLTAQIDELKRNLEKKTENEQLVVNDKESTELLVRLLEENKRLKDEKKKSQELYEEQDRDREVIKKVLSDVKTQAQAMLMNAEKVAQEKRRRADEELKNELQNRVIEFITTSYRINDFVKEIDSICGNLQDISESLKRIPQEVPAKVLHILDEFENDVVDMPDENPEAESTAASSIVCEKESALNIENQE